MKKPRVKKLSLEDRKTIKDIYERKVYTMKKIGMMFGVSESRISQIVTDYYQESEYEIKTE